MENKDIGKPAVPETLPLLPVKDVVIFPYMIISLMVGRETSLQAVEEALSGEKLLFLSAQKNIHDELVNPDGIYKTGCVVSVLRVHKLPDGRLKILVQGLHRSVIEEFTQYSPTFVVRHKLLPDAAVPEERRTEAEALVRTVRENVERLLGMGKIISPDAMIALDEVSDPGRLADLMAANLGLKVPEAQPVLEMTDPVDRLSKVNEILVKEIEVYNVKQHIQNRAKQEMGKLQREYFLREQMRAIRNELGDGDPKGDEIEELREKVAKANMPAEVEAETLKQIRRLETMHPDSAEASIVRTYIETLVDLPWSKSSKDNIDLKRAKKILDEDHFDMDKAKERILEFLGVCKLKKKMRGPILCFVGPPGVGKTSLGKSIARAMGRKFIRMSLGGVKDEAEIRGHRRTYVGAMPGRIIQGIRQAGTNNPVFVLDEVDKLGSDFRGDPSSALLEVLDPEQNFSFRDHYVNLPFDLSRVMFIATANLIDPIPQALRDRMEILTLPGYTEEEKLEIAKRYLVPRQREENGLGSYKIEFDEEAIRKIIRLYTREAGVRNLEREIASVLRKIARNAAEGEEPKKKVTAEDIDAFLGPPRFLSEDERQKDEVGVATGLAWTSAGGQVLYVESTLMKGKGILTLTGQLGDVMKESARAALSYARSRASELGIDSSKFSKYDIHIHLPAGAIPKDGPSAGVTIATALISSLTGRKVNHRVAMTGEITLRGRVLPVGGIKEKVLAAVRHGIKEIIIPLRNKRDLEEIPKPLLENIKIILVEHMDEVLKVALAAKLQGARRVKSKKASSKTRRHLSASSQQ